MSAPKTDKYVLVAHGSLDDTARAKAILGGPVVGQTLARELVEIFLTARFSGAERHRRRLSKVTALKSKEGSWETIL